jgi:hypothetical protein
MQPMLFAGLCERLRRRRMAASGSLAYHLRAESAATFGFKRAGFDAASIVLPSF